MKNAFTMIELIFVIVIIGILASVAIPKLTATRDDAEVSTIVSNAKILLNDFQKYYYSQGEAQWLSENITKVTNVDLYDTNCGNNITSATMITPKTFVLCHKDIICLSFTTVDGGILTIADGTVTSDTICENVKTDRAIMAMSNRSYKLGGKKVKR